VVQNFNRALRIRYISFKFEKRQLNNLFQGYLIVIGNCDETFVHQSQQTNKQTKIGMIIFDSQWPKATRLFRLREVWSSNLRWTESVTTLQTVRHRFNISTQECKTVMTQSQALWEGDTGPELPLLVTEKQLKGH